MTKQRKYGIRVQGIFVPVTKEVYLAYYQMERRERTLSEKDARHGLLYYNALDTEYLRGEELLVHESACTVEEEAIAHMIQEQLRQCLKQLSKKEQELLYALYVEGLSERQFSKQTGIPHRTINARKQRILARLKKMLRI